jgi:hypothetical protein
MGLPALTVNIRGEYSFSLGRPFWEKKHQLPGHIGCQSEKPLRPERVNLISMHIGSDNKCAITRNCEMRAT